METQIQSMKNIIPIISGNSGIEYYPFQQTAYWTAWLLISVAFGLRGKEWREQKLLERGYEPTYIKAESRELAILQFKSESTDEETNKPQESVMSMSKDLIKRKIHDPNGTLNQQSHFTLSQIYSNLGDTEKSLENLKKSASLGWVPAQNTLIKPPSHIKRNLDLIILWVYTRFKMNCSL